MKKFSVFLLSLALLMLLTVQAWAAQPLVWPVKKANSWYAKQGWLVGANYIPASAINQLEMWQAESFNLKRIETELQWAQSLGMNTIRVFLHDLLWQQDPDGLIKRINQFLEVAARHKIRPMFVLFDSCWDPNPKLGPQRLPTPGVHNSGWVQSPSLAYLKDPASYSHLESYVKGVVGAFKKDQRILAWDVWNEPDNRNDSSYADPADKLDYVRSLLPQVFDWARASRPKQPLTSGVWQGNWSSEEKLSAIEKIQLHFSDIITFHNYGPPQDFALRVAWLARYNRPILNTEYMARVFDSTFQSILPIARNLKVGAYNWGFVAGKTQTYLPWDSWKKPYTAPPPVWFHDIFQTDGAPYSAAETDFIKRAISVNR